MADAAPTFKITAANGKKYRITAPKGTTKDQALQHFREQHPDLSDQQQSDIGPDPGVMEDLPRALVQGWVEDPVTAIGQIAGHATGVSAPDWWNNFLADERARATRTPWQRAVRTGANILNPLYRFLPEVAVASRLGTVAAPIARGAMQGAEGAALQPVDDDQGGGDFWRQKGIQTGVGALLGGWLGRVLGGTEARTAAQQTADQATADLGKAQAYNKAVKAGNEARRMRNIKNQENFQKAQAKAQDDYNKGVQAALEKHQGDRERARADLDKATDRWQKARDKAQSDYNETLAAQEKEHQANVAKAQREASQRGKAAQEAVPGETSLAWWREALTPIGEADRAPTELSPEAGAQVQTIIGGRLNQLRSQMTFQPSAQIAKRLGAVKDATAKEIDPNDRGRWEATYLDLIGQPLAGERLMTGRRLADYVSQIGKRAEDLVDAGRYAEARGLWRIQDIIEDEASAGNATLRQELGNAKRSYQIWSIGNDAMKARYGGEANPEDIAAAWEKRQGTAKYGADTNPENVRLKRWLEQQRRAHRAPPPPTPAEVARPEPPPPPQIPRPPTAAPVPPPALPTPPTPGAAPKWINPRPARPEPTVPPVPEPRKIPTWARAATHLGTYALMDLLGMPWYERYTAAALADPEWARRAAQYLSRYPASVGAGSAQLQQSPLVQPSIDELLGGE
jgi:hypothetical protein